MTGAKPPTRDVFSPLVFTVAGALFLWSGLSLVTAYTEDIFSTRRRRSKKGKKALTTDNGAAGTRPSKDWHESVVQATFAADAQMCEYPFAAETQHLRPLIRAGSLLKLIDIIAGIAARRHAGGSCVTVSLDSVSILGSIRAGDLIHLSAAVNRAFKSSMEIGVRVSKEEPTEPGKLKYVSHAYLTFVQSQRLSKEQNLPLIVPDLLPHTPLQWRRHFLAGLRRQRRLTAAKAGTDEDGVSVEVKEEIRSDFVEDQTTRWYVQDDLHTDKFKMHQVELELLARTIFGKPDEHIEVSVSPNGMVDAYLKGEREGYHIRQALDKVRDMGDTLGLLDPPASETAVMATTAKTGSEGIASQGTKQAQTNRTDHTRIKSSPDERIQASETRATSLHLVFPQHANSLQILFGGQLMEWMEETALMSARHLLPATRRNKLATAWKTVAVDGLEFKRPVHLGEVMTFNAVCLRTFDKSCEVYVVASAESHGASEGETTTRRFTNDALFTLALTSPLESESAEGPKAQLRQVSTEQGTALSKFAEAADLRRQRRLALKDMLLRLYATDAPSPTA